MRYGKMIYRTLFPPPLWYLPTNLLHSFYPSQKLSDLETGKCCIFRVKALNKAGVGPPSLPSDPVVVKTKPGTELPVSCSPPALFPNTFLLSDAYFLDFIAYSSAHYLTVSCCLGLVLKEKVIIPSLFRRQIFFLFFCRHQWNRSWSGWGRIHLPGLWGSWSGWYLRVYLDQGLRRAPKSRQGPNYWQRW